MDLHFDPDAHIYRINGQIVPSVTQLLKPIGPDFSMVAFDVLEAKRALGVAVHLACELDDDDDLDDDGLDPVLVPYLSAWRKFKADTRAMIVMNERQLGHPALQYAGTLDRLAKIRSDMWLLDIKTSAEPHASYGVQLSGYEELLRADEFTDQPLTRATVHLRDDGTYRLHEFKNPNDHAAFRACLSIHHWKESQK
jgi:hypothetical protein